jgi:hypothetical protein
MSTKVKVGLASAILVIALTALPHNRRLNIVPQVHAQETEACTDQTLAGRYVFTGQGFFGLPNTVIPAANVGFFVSDGHGKISGSDALSFGGQITPRTFMGTYKVNSDCTATAALNFGPSLIVDLALVLDDRGHEVRALQTNPPGAVFTALARKTHKEHE